MGSEHIFVFEGGCAVLSRAGSQSAGFCPDREVWIMYQALYRKYRPQTFDDVAGQNSVNQTLRDQVVTGKLSHA